MSISIRTFNPINPLELLHGNTGMWVRLIIYCGLFIAMTNAVFSLMPHFKDNHYAKKLAFFLGLILGVGLFMAEKHLNFNIESFSFMSVWFIVILFGLLAFGMFRTGMGSKQAFGVSYCIIFLSFIVITPTLYDSIILALPFLSVFLWLMFIVSAYFVVSGFFNKFHEPGPDKLLKRFNPKQLSRDVAKTHFLNEDDVEIDREIDEDKKEVKKIKYFTRPVSKKEIKTIEDIKGCLEGMIKIIKRRGGALKDEDITILINNLRTIAKNESILKNGLAYIKKHTSTYRATHKKDIPFLEKRMSNTESLQGKRLIKEEIDYQGKILEAIKFLEDNEMKILAFTQSFNRLLSEAINKLKSQLPEECLRFLEVAKSSLERMENIYYHQKEIENYLIKVDKKTIKDLKKEKKMVQS